MNVPVPSGVPVFRGLTQPGSRVGDTLAPIAFFKLTRDEKDGVSLVDASRKPLCCDVCPDLRRKGVKTCEGAAESVTDKINAIRSKATGVQLSVMRTPEQDQNPANSHCHIEGLDTTEKLSSPTREQVQDANAIIRAFTICHKE